MTKPLSPAAQAVRDAWDAKLNPDPDGLTYLTHDPEREALAAALRAAADQVVPLTPKPNDTFCCPPVYTMLWDCRTDIRNQLLAIAAELEAQP